MEDYLILGACNPPLAHRAVNADRQIGSLLPCNVAVRADITAGGDAVIVDAMDPQAMVQLSDQPGLREVADEGGDQVAGRTRRPRVRRQGIVRHEAIVAKGRRSPAWPADVHLVV